MPRDPRNTGSVRRLEPDAPAVLYVELRAPIGDAARLAAYVTAFCDAHASTSLYARAITERNQGGRSVVVYLAINGGTARGAVRGDPEAHRAARTLAAAVAELHMFDPVLVARPDTATDEVGSEEHHERRA
jgi:hypothetical protein